MDSKESFTPAIFFKKTASEDRSENPVSIGFITPISIPEFARRQPIRLPRLSFPLPYPFL
jgi:hypothetical protein